MPIAVNTSRRKVLERTWDKTTINLPFGRSAIFFGEPIHVARDAGDDEMEAKRRDLTEAMNRVTERARIVADGAG